MKTKRVSIHLSSYRRKAKLDNVEKKILNLVEKVQDITGKDKSEISILDVGCGAGVLVEALTKEGYSILGIDSDEKCVEITRNYGKAMLMDAGEIGKSLRQDFDIIIFKDSLEHMDNPLEVVNQAKGISRWILIAVPNPTRPEALLYDIIRRNYSNPGHFCCWERSHLHYFLVNKAKLEIVQWEVDEIRLFFGPLHFFTRVLERLGLNIIGIIEGKLLPKIFPYFSSKLIVLTQVKQEVGR